MIWRRALPVTVGFALGLAVKALFGWEGLAILNAIALAVVVITDLQQRRR